MCMNITETATRPVDSGTILPESIYKITDTMAHAARLATLAVLDQTPNEFVRGAELCQRLEDIQDKDRPWSFKANSPRTPFDYCSPTMQAIGLVDIGRIVGKCRPLRAAKITPLGSELWPAIAGAYLSWQERHPQVSLIEVVGPARPVFKVGSSIRLKIFEQLLAQPEGYASAPDISRAAHISESTVLHYATELQGLDLLRFQTVMGPDRRSYIIDKPSENAKRYFSRISPELQVTIRGLTALWEEGTREVNGVEIIRKAKELYPNINSKAAWKQFLEWALVSQSSTSFVREVNPLDDAKSRSKLQIAEHCVEPIKELLELRTMLATDAGFRRDAARSGQLLFGNKQSVTRHIRRAMRESPTLDRADDLKWEAIFYKHIPPEGISFAALRDAMAKRSAKTVTARAVVRRITSMPDIVQVVNRPVLEGVVQKPHVLLRQHSYSTVWADQAACGVPGIDLDLFQDQPANHEGNAKTLQAINYCRSCPVRRACLRTAVENNEPEGVWGGLTAKDRQQLSRVQKDAILATVKIRNTKV
jgi:WhiB family transcriptional regulator, redox-sensing transcriptional regulator